MSDTRKTISIWPYIEGTLEYEQIELEIYPVDLPEITVQDTRTGKRYQIVPEQTGNPMSCRWYASEL